MNLPNGLNSRTKMNNKQITGHRINFKDFKPSSNWFPSVVSSSNLNSTQNARFNSNLKKHALPNVDTNRLQTVAVREVASPSFRFGSDAVQGGRESMEDYLQIDYDSNSDHIFAALFDGHGGTAAAEWLTSQLHRTLTDYMFAVSSQNLQASSSSKTLRDSLLSSFAAADRALVTHLKELSAEDTGSIGSTATVALIFKDKIAVANIGDSQAVLCRKGVALPLTTPHRVYGSGPEVTAEIERVNAVGGWVDDGRVCGVLAVSRAFGDYEFKGAGLETLLPSGVARGYWNEKFASSKQGCILSDPVIAVPDICEHDITPDDEFLVIASDGLWDVMNQLDVVRWARKEFQKKKDAKQIAESLTTVAVRRYTTDNVAVIVVDLKGEGYWNPPPKPTPPKRFGFF